MIRAYHVTADNVIEDCFEDLCELPWGRHFEDEEMAEAFVAKNNVEAARFVLDERIRPEYRHNRAQRAFEPPLISGVNNNNSEHTFEELTDAGFVPDDETPNMRNFKSPDARYVGAQARSARVSGQHDRATLRSEMGEPHEMYQNKVINGQKVMIKTDVSGFLSDHNLYAFEDDDAVIHYEHGVVHRDPKIGPAVICKDGRSKAYVYHGLMHNPDGPALITDDVVAYYQNGLLHNEIFPAITHNSGKREYWEKGKFIRSVEAPAATSSGVIAEKAARAYAQVSDAETAEMDGISRF